MRIQSTGNVFCRQCNLFVEKVISNGSADAQKFSVVCAKVMVCISIFRPKNIFPGSFLELIFKIYGKTQMIKQKNQCVFNH